MQGAFAAQAKSTIVKIPYNVSAENKSFFFTNRHVQGWIMIQVELREMQRCYSYYIRVQME